MNNTGTVALSRNLTAVCDCRQCSLCPKNIQQEGLREKVERLCRPLRVS